MDKSFVEADRFFNALFDGGYADRFPWKDISRKTSDYNVTVICNRCHNSIHLYSVHVRDGVHYVDLSAVYEFTFSHKVKASDLQD